jgi:uncharacterized membrane protein YjjP (DUF1212 family)
MDVPGDEMNGPRTAEIAELLGDVAAGLHGVSMPSDVVAEELRAIGDRQGVPVQSLILQSRLELQVGRGPGSEVVLRSIDFDTSWNLRRLSDLQGVVARLRGAKKATSEDLGAARREIAQIVARPSAFSTWAVVLAYGAYAAAVTARIGGSWREVAAGIIVGLVAGAVHYGSTRSRGLDLVQSFTGALCGTLAAFLLRLVLPPFDQARAVFGGMSLLVPAMVLTIGTSEMVHDALESGALRVGYALLRFLMMGFGVAAAMKLYLLFGPIPASVTAVPLATPIMMTLVAMGGVALTVCLQGRWADTPWLVAGVLTAFGSHELTKLIFPPDGSPFLAAFLLGAVAIAQYRLGGRLPAIVIIPGFLQIAPGFLGTESVLALLRPGSHPGTDTFFHVVLLALQLVTGLLVAEGVFSWSGPRSSAHARRRHGLRAGAAQVEAPK